MSGSSIAVRCFNVENVGKLCADLDTDREVYASLLRDPNQDKEEKNKYFAELRRITTIKSSMIFMCAAHQMNLSSMAGLGSAIYAYCTLANETTSPAARADAWAKVAESLAKVIEQVDKMANNEVLKSELAVQLEQKRVKEVEASTAEKEASTAQKEMETRHQQRTVFGRAWAFFAGKK
jgi:hypothetical protein